MKSFVFAVSAFFLLMPPLRADLYVKSVNHTPEMTVGGKIQPAQDVPYEMWIAEDKLAGVNAGGVTVVLDFARKRMLEVNHRDKTYSELDLPLRKEQLEAAGRLPMFSGTASVTPLNRQRLVGPWLCDGYRFVVRMMGRELVQTVWHTAQVRPEWTRYLESGVRKHEMHFFDEESLRQTRQLRGFQVRNDFTAESDAGPVDCYGQVEVMEERTPPEGIYSVPEGYRRLNSRP